MTNLLMNRHQRRASSKVSNKSPRAKDSLFLASALLLSGTWINVAQADILPTGGNVVAGSGSISQNAGQMTITQTTDKMAVNWQSFSIGQGNSVTFNQPSASSIALNRVLGSDVSVIQGALNANGRVYLINPNGVLFSSTAQVNVGGLVASTLDLKTEDFLAGKYTFEGASSNAVINQGNITAAPGGTIALIAAKIVNEGILTAQGGNVLLGAGSKVTLDLGGPVKIQVDEAAIDALITQGGAIKADGGVIYLTAKAAGNLVTTVINNTGIIEAQTLVTGETGEIILLGGNEVSKIVVGGTLDASAPNGGNGGFIETSAKIVQFADDVKVTTASVDGIGGTWLIDPTNITISATSCTGANCIAANTLQTTLNGGTSVTIATDSSGSEDGDITVNAPLSWSASKLTLSAADDIVINQTLTATNTASLAFQYGQSSTDGANGTYSFGSGAKLYVPDSSAFTWKKGTAGTTTYVVLNSGMLRFGTGSEGSIDANGQLKQPYYFDNTSIVDGVARNGWFKLTYSSYPLDLQLAEGGDGTNTWNTNGTTLSTNGTYTSAITSKNLELSGYTEGTGSVVSTVNLNFGSGVTLAVANTYTLVTGEAYVKTDTVVTNTSASSVDNIRLWVGTRDDWIAQSDQPYKFKGNITSDGFVEITDPTTQAKALKITERNDGEGAAVLFYSTSAGANTSIALCCSFSNSTNIDPTTSKMFSTYDGTTLSGTDGSYALFMRLSDLTPGSSSGMTWYYAAAPVAEIANVVENVSVSAGVTPTPTPEPTPAPVVVITEPVLVVEPTQQFQAAIQTAQTQSATVQSTSAATAAPATAAATIASIAGPTTVTTPLPSTTSIGSLRVVELSTPSPQAGGTPAQGGQSGSTSESQDTSTGSAAILRQEAADTSGFMKVFVVNGGINTQGSVTEE